MICVKVEKENGRYRKLSFQGHADYGEYGADIVCAGVSALLVNAVNSIEAFTEDAFTCDVNSEGQITSLAFEEEISKECMLLLDSLVLGLKNISEAYGEEYIRIQGLPFQGHGH